VALADFWQVVAVVAILLGFAVLGLALGEKVK